jgi:hypothetical protein
LHFQNTGGLHFQKTGGLHFLMRNEPLGEINFDAENCFNLRHHNIVTLLSGRRSALDTSCSLATRVMLTDRESR